MPRPSRSRRSRPLLLVGALILVAAVVAAAVVTAVTAGQSRATVAAHDVTISVVDGPHHDQHVRLAATVYVPDHTPAPAIIVSPGFGADKHTIAGEAKDLAQRGFVTLAYTARGFAASTGRIALNSPDFEVADARQLVSWLAQRPDVVKDGPGDPKIGVTGASYGGALALMLAGTDPRIDAIAPVITYNDLGAALLPNFGGTTQHPTPAAIGNGKDGVFKRAWTGRLFAAGLRGGSASGDVPRSCGRFIAEVCTAYQEMMTTGKASPSTLALLHRDSPASVTGHIRIPTLLVQGEQDTLFGLGQADANARQIHAAGGKVKVVWYAGGHDGGAPGPAVEDDIGAWFSYYLDGRGENPGTGFSYQVPGATSENGKRTVRTVAASAYPGLVDGSTQQRELPLSGGTAPVLNPAGGNPAAVSSLPGIGGRLGPLSSALAVDIPGESAHFTTPPLRAQLLTAGSARVRLRVQGRAGAVLFAKLYDVAPDGTKTLPGGGVAPFRIPPGGGTVTVDLPGIVHPIQAGHRVELVVSTTDQSYENATRPGVYRVGVDGGIAIPNVAGSSSSAAAFPVGQLVAIGVVLLLCALSGGYLAWRGRSRRRRGKDFDPELAEVPLALNDLGKTYRGRLRVVDALSFRVERGQVLGLLGPNGAGKTTALRMLLGLVRPTTGDVRVFGHRIAAGSPVLSRIGAFVERPGFLPHLSGLTNLRLHWRATGRPSEDARMDEALEIADLGDAVHRKVGTYSLGMRQRLAIAQAMLGMPELLVLDEPTNGLDPPQIRDTRDMLLRYAATGRTVLVSSHVLAEVEQTCSHVVVMNRGRLIASGAVAELVGAGGESSFTVDDPDRAIRVLSTVDGVSVVRDDDHVVHAALGSSTRPDAVTALVRAGVRVDKAGPRGRLEDVFLRLVEKEVDS